MMYVEIAIESHEIRKAMDNHWQSELFNDGREEPSY